MRFHQKHHDICIHRAAPSRRHHRPIKTPPRFEKPRRVHEHQLCGPFHTNSTNTRARCLHFMRNNRYFRTNHSVQKRRLPSIGFTNQRDKACLGHVSASIVFKRACAAACSAARLVPALARADGPSESWASISKTGA